MPVSTWIGKLFYVLLKQELLRYHGYELYDRKPFDTNSPPIKSSWALPNHRIMCDSISGDTLLVDSLIPVKNEWIVVFRHLRSQRIVYGSTRQQCIQEVCLLSELVNAKNRWQSTFVFSKRGIISVFSPTNSTSIVSKKVRVLDSLLVTGVTFGQTPLPIAPLWLSVTVQSTGISGFLPIRYSWTNTLAGQITNKNPWDDDIFENDPRSHYDWDDYTWEVIDNHRVILEMTPDQVLLSWGTPEKTMVDSTAAGREIWLYPSHECTFTAGILSAITERK